jgi:AspT/YidE/YbjL antiporter-like protein
MLEMARDIIGTQPILALFLAIGVGYVVGQINVGGFSLGVGAVLFVGLAIGAFAPKAQITGPISLTGLIMFLYGIGILYGRQFFEGMTGAEGRKYNLLAAVGVVAGLAVALGLGQAFGIKIGHTLGLFAGSMTSTATLQAALDVMHNSEPSIGYSIAYPFGVIGPILCIYFMTRHIQPKFPPKTQRFHMAEVTLGDNCTGRTLDELSKDLPGGVRTTMVRKGHQNIIPSADIVLASGDGLLISYSEIKYLWLKYHIYLRDCCSRAKSNTRVPKCGRGQPPSGKLERGRPWRVVVATDICVGMAPTGGTHHGLLLERTGRDLRRQSDHRRRQCNDRVWRAEPCTRDGRRARPLKKDPTEEGFGEQPPAPSRRGSVSVDPDFSAAPPILSLWRCVIPSQGPLLKEGRQAALVARLGPSKPCPLPW